MEYSVTITTDKYFDFKKTRDMLYDNLSGILTIFNIDMSYQSIEFDVNTHLYAEEIESTLYDALCDGLDIDNISVT